MPVKGQRQSAEARERISRGTKYGVRVAREKRRMRQPVLDAYSHDGVVGEPMKPILRRAQEELAGWLQARGGVDAVSELERSVLDDAAALGVVRDALIGLFLESQDPELATKISTLTAARRSSLQAIGLERRERDVLDLRQYLEQHEATTAEPTQAAQTGVGKTNSSVPGGDVMDATEHGSGDEK